MATKGGWAEAAKSMELPAYIPRDAWVGFVEMRALKRQPLTARACTLMFARLTMFKAAGQDVGAVLDQSTEHCWAGVYPLKNPSVPLSEERSSLADRAI